MGPKHGTGVSNRFCVGATPTIPPYSPTSLLSSESADSRGTIQPQPKTSNQTAGVPLGDRFLLQHFPGSQKEWGTEAGDQPQSSEPVCSPRTFQNGGHTHLKGPDETRGLVGKDRPQGCLSGDPDRPDTLRLSQVSIRWQDIPLHLPAIRTILIPLGLHKNTETCPGPSTCKGSTTYSLYR